MITQLVRGRLSVLAAVLTLSKVAGAQQVLAARDTRKKISAPASSFPALLLLVCGASACLSQRSLAQTAEGSEGLGGEALGDIYGDGDLGATFGTLIFNTWINPAQPLPLPKSDNDAINQTMQNLGAGQSLSDAWKHGAASAAGFESEAQQSSPGAPVAAGNAPKQDSSGGAASPQPSPRPGPQPQSVVNAQAPAYGHGGGVPSPQPSPQPAPQPQVGFGSQSDNVPTQTGFGSPTPSATPNSATRPLDDALDGPTDNAPVQTPSDSPTPSPTPGRTPTSADSPQNNDADDSDSEDMRAVRRAAISSIKSNWNTASLRTVTPNAHAAQGSTTGASLNSRAQEPGVLGRQGPSSSPSATAARQTN